MAAIVMRLNKNSEIEGTCYVNDSATLSLREKDFLTANFSAYIEIADMQAVRMIELALEKVKKELLK